MSDTAKRVATRLKVFGFSTVTVIALVAGVVLIPSDGGGTIVPAPSSEMRAETTASLARASAAQGICYGWRLSSEDQTTVSRGSNLGPDAAVDSDPERCPRWIQVEAWVLYTAADSEVSDAAITRITMSGVTTPLTGDLDRFGLTTDAFIDAPDRAICQAALVLPLLAAESGNAPPVPTAPPTTAPTTTPAALPDAGSDFWRDRWAHVLGGSFLLLVAALVIAIGWFERQHERRQPVLPGQTTARGQATAKGRAHQARKT